jgi:hypothetical protein
MVVRWAVVVIAYAIASSAPGAPAVRLVPGFIGVAFLSWPNFAWYATRPFVDWKVAQGHVVSVSGTDSGYAVVYDFQYGDERVGGTARVKTGESVGPDYSLGQSIRVRYDPLNPNVSKIG